MNDVLAIYVPCFQSTLGSLGHRFQIRAPCPVFALFWYLGWLSIQQIKDRVIEICIKNKDVHFSGILKKCLMYQNAQKGKHLNNCITMSTALQRLGQESNNIK